MWVFLIENFEGLILKTVNVAFRKLETLFMLIYYRFSLIFNRFLNRLIQVLTKGIFDTQYADMWPFIVSTKMTRVRLFLFAAFLKVRHVNIKMKLICLTG